MLKFVIYDTTGYIIPYTSFDPIPKVPEGIPSMWVDVPIGKQLVSIDISVIPNVAILEDIPTLDLLKIKTKDLEVANTELLENNETLKIRLFDAEQVSAETSNTLQMVIETLIDGGVI